MCCADYGGACCGGWLGQAYQRRRWTWRCACHVMTSTAAWSFCTCPTPRSPTYRPTSTRNSSCSLSSASECCLAHARGAQRLMCHLNLLLCRLIMAGRKAFELRVEPKDVRIAFVFVCQHRGGRRECMALTRAFRCVDQDRDVRDVIAEVANQEHATLMVLGQFGRKGPSVWSSGSNTDWIVRSMPCVEGATCGRWPSRTFLPSPSPGRFCRQSPIIVKVHSDAMTKEQPYQCVFYPACSRSSPY